ncbi:MAG: helix-turn-helix transcriptional regulator [Lachnospiraceae bacterium]|nr:helix-turn-helix transcriptional regulator [Lachnospiraceae bacterium]
MKERCDSVSVRKKSSAIYKKLRKSYNYSQEFVAPQLFITRQTYSHYETGRITPPVNSLYNLSKLYNIPMENFLEFTTSYNHYQKSESNNAISDSLSDNDLSEFLEHT